MKMLTLLIFALFISIPCEARAEQQQIIPGKYVTEGGWGNLSILKNNNGELAFEISALGANAHMCELGGKIKGAQATLEGMEGYAPCVISFTPQNQQIEVTIKAGECSIYCGARAGFTAVYYKPGKDCTPANVLKSRNRFKALYDKKAYPQAASALEPVLKNCEFYLPWPDKWWIRNDLALTKHKLGLNAECIKLLQPVSEWAKVVTLPPVEEELWKPIQKATQTNIGLCQKGL